MVKRVKKILRIGYDFALRIIPFLRPIYETRRTQTPIKISMWFLQKVVGFNRHVYWPVHFSSVVTNYKNICAGVETCPGYMPGCYIQGIGKIIIGNYTQISCNVGLITSNHDIYDNRKHPHRGEIRIGEYCWIGMNVVILPTVVLGDFTIVGAGAVVTHSFPDGYCVIAGNPAKMIKALVKEKCVRHKSKFEYCGYIPKDNFADFTKHHLNL